MFPHAMGQCHHQKKKCEASKLAMRISVLQKRTRTRTNNLWTKPETSKWDSVGKVTEQIIGLIS